MKDLISQFFIEFKKIRTKGSFVQNVSIVFTGNVINFLLQLIFTPIISRIYGPGAYGEYAYYNLIVTNVGFLASMSFPSIYVLPKTRYEFLALGKVVFFSVLGFTLLSLGLFLLLEESVFSYDESLFAIPIIILTVLLNSFNEIQSSWNIREKKFRKNTSVGVSSTFISKNAVVASGYFWSVSGLGLLLGDFIRSFIRIFTQTRKHARFIILRFLLKNNWSDILNVFKKNINVPKFIFPSQILSKWTADLPVIAIGAYYSKESLGIYIFAVTILNIPKNLVANSIRPVMFQKANEVYINSPDSLINFFLKSFKLISSLALISFIIMSPLSVLLFPLVFGEEWTEAGLVVSLISMSYLTTLIITPFIDFWRILKYEKELLKLNILITVFKIFPFVFLLWDLSFNQFLVVYTIFYSIGVSLLIGSLFSKFFSTALAIKYYLISVFIIGISYLIILFSSFPLFNYST